MCMHSGVGELVSPWKICVYVSSSYFFMSFFETVYNTGTLFYKILCFDINMLTTHGLDSSLLWCQPHPKGPRLGRCALYNKRY
jgi:hypothetical protein